MITTIPINLETCLTVMSYFNQTPEHFWCDINVCIKPFEIKVRLWKISDKSFMYSNFNISNGVNL